MKKLYNICISIVEAKYLAWIDRETYVEIEINGKVKRTKTKECSDRPFYNEYFVFELKKLFPDLMSTDILIKMYEPSSKFHRRKLLASTRLDIGSVWNRKDHQFHNEWFVLRNNAKEKGFLRCDMSVVASDTQSSQLLPSIDQTIRFGSVSKGDFVVSKMAIYCIRVYKGGDMQNLPDLTSKSGSLKKQSKISVGISCCGISTRTSEQSNKVGVIWNEEFKFPSPIPPVYHKLKLDLLVNRKAVSSILILMDEISCFSDKKTGFLPSFGPAHKYFYSPNNVYYGYIIFSIESFEMQDGREDDKSNAIRKNQISGLIEEKEFGFQFMCCFCFIFEVSMLNRNSCLGRELTVSMEFGREGLTGSNNTSVTQPMVAEKTDGDYCWLPFGRRKPCLFIKDKLPDTRWRLFLANSLIKVSHNLEENLSLVDKEELAGNKLKILLNGLKSLKTDCENVYFTIGTTQLDQERPKFIKNMLNNISTDVDRIMKVKKFKKMYQDTKHLLDLIKKYTNDPQDSLPSIIFNVWKGNKRMYTCRISPEDVIHANNPSFRGFNCGQLKTMFTDEIGPNLNKTKFKGKLVSYIWLGVQEDINQWHKSLPEGFLFGPLVEDSSSLVERNSIFQTGSIIDVSVPKCISYHEHFDCICYVHIEQAYFEDQSLFNSPSYTKVKIMFKNGSSETREIIGMQLFAWSQLLCTAPVAMYGVRSYYEERGPTIFIEVWQRKKKTLLVGSISLSVNLRNSNTGAENKKFEFHSIMDGSARVGKLLLYAEIIEIYEGMENYRPILKSSSTDTSSFRLEVFFWGVRDLKYHSANVCIKITVGNFTISSMSLENQKGCFNFIKQGLIVKDMMLPKAKHFSPMMIVNLVETIDKDTKKYKGCCSVRDIHSTFGYHPITRDEWERIQSSPNSNSLHLESSRRHDEFNAKKHNNNDFFGSFKFRVPILLLDILWLVKRLTLFISYCITKLLSKCQRNIVYEDLKDTEHLAEPVLRLKNKTEERNNWWSKYYSGKKLVEKSNLSSTLDKVVDELTIPTQPTLEYYSGELEQEFDGFTDFLKVFDLTESDLKEASLNSSICKVKAAVTLYEVPSLEEDALTMDGGHLHDNYVLTHLPFNSPTRLLLRVYIIQAYNLFSKQEQPMNPYIVASVPSASVENFAAHLADQSNPCFGLSFELVAELPKDYQLTITIMNYIRFGKKELIGETKVDLENRYYTKHRARCGLQTNYIAEGSNRWRDQLQPSEILENLCQENKIAAPIFRPNSIIVAGKEFSFPTFLPNVKEAMSLDVLLRWEEVPIVGCKLVREHVETRPLYNPNCPGIIQGNIEMWVDLFDLSGPPPLAPLVDITPREPQAYELRIIIYKTCKVQLIDNEMSVGYKHSDIFVKGWMLGKSDTQSTDVHFKSLSGDGYFNWRFIFPFQYLPMEECITLNDPQTSSKKKNLIKIPPKVYLQVSDKERLYPDRFIGLLSLDLRHMIKGASRWWLCKSYVDESPRNTVNLFEERKMKGWWPFYGSQRFKQKNQITGYLEAEFHLVTYFEALCSPVGYGRDEPDGLEEPMRKVLNYTFWLLPCRLLLHLIGMNKGTILVVIGISAAVLFFLLGIYAIPTNVVRRIIGNK